METDNAKRPSAIEGIKRPSALIWLAAVPQAILIALNIGAYWVIKSEINAEGKTAALFVLLLQIVIFACSLLLYADLKRRSRTANWLSSALLLALNVMYLWNFMSNIERLMPFSIMPWVLDQGEFIYYQFIFVMPAIFYSAIMLSSFKTKLDKRVDTGVSLVILLVIPMVWYVIFNIPFLRRGLDFSALFILLFVVVSTLALLVLLLRILVALYSWAAGLGAKGMTVLTFLFGLALPLGGLLLNSSIPFPADFQAPIVYLLAAVNGIILMIPLTGKRPADRALWLARCAMLPFTLYFFLVFLPFLPLALFAILAMGTGFLILAPTALFIIHCRSIGDGYAKLWDGAKAMPAALAAAAVLAIPVCFTVSSVLDRISLFKAVDYVYSPDYAGQSKYDGDACAAANAMLKLRDYKKGVTVPFVSSYYNKIVFNGMVLQDSKMENLYKIFSGEDMANARSGFGFLRSRSRFRDSFRNSGALSSAATSPVNMVSAEVSDGGSGEYAKKRVTIRMKNTGRDNSEFNADINVPPYVLVSGYWLDIGGKLVPGDIFERKTAMWVYRMIRDSRRDPGLLIYKPDGSLNLSVYPFASSEERVSVIEFTYPQGFSPDIKIGEKYISLGSVGTSAEMTFALSPDKDGFFLYMPPGKADGLPCVTRKPYLHFILDYSKNSGQIGKDYAKRIKEICTGFPDARQIYLTAANFEFSDIGRFDADDQEGISEAIASCGMQRRGAFLKERAVKRALLMYENNAMAEQPDGPGFMKYPVFIAVTGNDAVPVDEGSFSAFSAIVPEDGGYHVSVPGSNVAPAQEFRARAVNRVVVFRSSGALAVCGKGAPVAYFSRGDGRNIEAYEGETGKFRALEAAPAGLSGDIYPVAAQARLKNIQLNRNPSLAPELIGEVVDLSRKSGVLVPATAYIVVENEAQKRRMELKELQKLKSSQALSFDENPEEITPLKASAPPMAVTALCVMLPAVLAMGWIRKRRSLTPPRP